MHLALCSGAGLRDISAPVGNYPALLLLISQVKAALAPLAADLRPTGSEGIHDINDTFKAHHGTVQYMLQKRLY